MITLSLLLILCVCNGDRDDDANGDIDDGNDNSDRDDDGNDNADGDGKDNDDRNDDGNGDVLSPISPASGQQRVAWACKELLTNALLTNTISALLYMNTQTQYRMSLQFTLIGHPLISCILFVLKCSVLHIELDSGWPPPLYSHHWAEIASSGRPHPPAKVFFLVSN